MKWHNVKYLTREGFHNLWTNRTMTLASVAVLISCLLLTGAAMLRYKARETYPEPRNAVDAFLDSAYDDAFMEKRWPNMKRTDAAPQTGLAAEIGAAIETALEDAGQ